MKQEQHVSLSFVVRTIPKQNSHEIRSCWLRSLRGEDSEFRVLERSWMSTKILRITATCHNPKF